MAIMLEADLDKMLQNLHDTVADPATGVCPFKFILSREDGQETLDVTDELGLYVLRGMLAKENKEHNKNVWIVRSYLDSVFSLALVGL